MSQTGEVKFIGASDAGYLAAAMDYLVGVAHARPLIDHSSPLINFNGEGKAILPEQIRAVEIVQHASLASYS